METSEILKVVLEAVREPIPLAALVVLLLSSTIRISLTKVKTFQVKAGYRITLYVITVVALIALLTILGALALNFYELYLEGESSNASHAVLAQRIEVLEKELRLGNRGFSVPPSPSPRAAGIASELDVSKDSYESALRDIALKRFEIAREKLGLIATRQSQNLAKVYLKLGQVEAYESDFDSAIGWLKKALEINDSNYEVLDELAVVYLYKGEYARSNEATRQSIAIKLGTWGRDAKQLAASYINRAGVAYQQGDYSGALEDYKEALALFEDEKDSSPTDEGDLATVARIKTEIGINYYDLGQFDEAEKYFDEAVEAIPRIGYTDELLVATALNHKALLHKRRAEYELAEMRYKEALEAAELASLSNHTFSIMILNNLSSLYFELEDYRQAKVVAETVLAKWKKVLSPEHLDIARALNNLSTIHTRLGEYDEALAYSLEAVSICESLSLDFHAICASVATNLGTVYLKQGNYALAENEYNKAIASFEEHLPPGHPFLGFALERLSDTYWAKGENEQATVTLGRSFQILLDSLGPEHPKVKEVQDKKKKLEKQLVG